MAQLAIARSYVPPPHPVTVPLPTPPVVYHNVLHTPPPSVSAQDWISFDKFTTDIFKRDFCHDNHITVNFRVPTLKQGYVKVKQELRWKDKDLHVNDQLRLWFPLTWRRSSYLYAHKLNDKVKVYYDNGFSRVGNYDINAYASLDFVKYFEKLNFNIGASHTTDNVYTNTRLRLYQDKVLDQVIQNFAVYHKTYLKYYNWKLGFDAVMNFSNNSQELIKKDLAIGYEHPQFSVYLKAQQAWGEPTKNYNIIKDIFSTISLTALYQHNPKELFGLEIITNPREKAVQQISALVEYRRGVANRIKAKINNRTLLTFLLERQVNSQLQARLGFRFPLDPSSFKKGEGKNGRFGVELSWNL